MQQKNYEKQNTQPLLGYESIYTEQTMRVKVLKLLLSLPNHMRRILLIFQILWSSKKSMKNMTMYIRNKTNLFLQRVVLSLSLKFF